MCLSEISSFKLSLNHLLSNHLFGEVEWLSSCLFLRQPLLADIAVWYRCCSGKLEVTVGSSPGICIVFCIVIVVVFVLSFLWNVELFKRVQRLLQIRWCQISFAWECLFSQWTSFCSCFLAFYHILCYCYECY